MANRFSHTHTARRAETKHRLREGSNGNGFAINYDPLVDDDLLAELVEVADPGRGQQPLMNIIDFIVSLPPDRPLLSDGGHPDDPELKAGAIQYCLHGVRQCVNLTFFSGHRSGRFAAKATKEDKIRQRRQESGLAATCLGAVPIALELAAYDLPKYRPTSKDLNKLLETVARINPAAWVVGPACDDHGAHRIVRSLSAFIYRELRLDCPVLTAATPWGALAHPTHYVAFDKNCWERLADSLRSYVSQRDGAYLQWKRGTTRAAAAILPQLVQGHYKSECAIRPFGVELFRLEPSHDDGLPFADPFVILRQSFPVATVGLDTTPRKHRNGAAK